MLVIFVFSHRQPLLDQVAGQYRFDGIDKLAHFFEYALLYCLLYRSFALDGFKNPMTKALFTGILYAMSDELHQGMLPYRQCQLGDLLADSLGVMASYVLHVKVKHLLPWAKEESSA